jgi:hypothetical protein
MKKVVVIVSVCTLFGASSVEAAAAFKAVGSAANGALEVASRFLRDTTGIAVAPVYNEEARQAIIRHDYQKVAAMLEAKAFGVNEVLDAHGNTPLIIAVNNARHQGSVYTDIIRLLLAYRALLLNAPQPGNGETALIIAARKGYSTIIKLLLHAGANREVCNADGKSPIAVARAMGQDYCAHLLAATSTVELWYTPFELAHFAAEDVRNACHCNFLDSLL